MARARTQEQIVARIRERESGDPFGFETGELLSCLAFQYAKPWLKDTATAESWGTPESAEPAAVIERMQKYMPFAWGKANDCRGISANRSVQHCQAWLWLAGEDELLADVDRLFADYRYYGKPILHRICEAFGWDWKTLDDGHWTNHEGEPGVTAEVALRG